MAQPCQNRMQKKTTERVLATRNRPSPNFGGRICWMISTEIMDPCRKATATPRKTDQIIAVRVITSDHVDGLPNTNRVVT